MSRYLLAACSQVIAQGYRSEKCICVSYIIFGCWSGICLIGVEMNLRHANKTRFWYLLGVFSKFSDEHPVTFIGEYLAPGNWYTTDIKPTQLSTKIKEIWSQFAVVPVHLFTDGSFLLLNYSALCLMGFKSRNSFPATNLTFGNWSSSWLFGCLSETRIASSETQNVHLSQPSNSNSRELKQQGQQRYYDQNNSSARASHFLPISLTYTARLRCKVKRPNATLWWRTLNFDFFMTFDR